MANVCNKCGNNLYGNKTKCPFCGEPINSSLKSSYNKPSSSTTGNKLSSSNYSSNNNAYSGYSNNNNSQSTPNGNATGSDTGSAGWGLLGFCFPIVGIILYLVWQNDQPLNAKAALNGALIAIVIGFIFGLFSACAQISYY